MPTKADRPDIVGQTYGALTVVTYVQRGRWSCICSCGNYETFRTQQVLKAPKCRHYRRGNVTKTDKQHPHYLRWYSMCRRCHDPRDKAYDSYGGRGIRVHEPWRLNFRSFVAGLKAIGPQPSPKHSLDRIDNDGNYEPGNLQWATASQQVRNRRKGRFITAFGRRRHIEEWAADLGTTGSIVHNRMALHGWTVEAAVSVPALPPGDSPNRRMIPTHMREVRVSKQYVPRKYSYSGSE